MTVTLPECPVGLRHGGGEGRWGLCLMELVSILQGSATDTIYVTADPESVHPDLVRLGIQVNDNYRALSSAERADALWPLIPGLLGTRGEEVNLDLSSFKERFNIPDSDSICTCGVCKMVSEGNWLRDYIQRCSNAERLQILDAAIDLYHETAGTTRRREFAPEELARLDAWLDAGFTNLDKVYTLNRDNPLVKRG